MLHVLTVYDDMHACEHLHLSRSILSLNCDRSSPVLVSLIQTPPVDLTRGGHTFTDQRPGAP